MIPRFKYISRQLDIFLLRDHFHSMVLSTENPIAHLRSHNHFMWRDAPQRRELIPPLNIFKRFNNIHPINWHFFMLALFDLGHNHSLCFLQLLFLVFHFVDDVVLLCVRIWAVSWRLLLLEVGRSEVAEVVFWGAWLNIVSVCLFGLLLSFFFFGFVGFKHF